MLFTLPQPRDYLNYTYFVWKIAALNVPQRRETTQRKAKSRGAIENQMYGCAIAQTDELDEPAAFAESDSDWAPSKDDIDYENQLRRKTAKKQRSTNSRSNRRGGKQSSDTGF